jgi:hypothetical protein
MSHSAFVAKAVMRAEFNRSYLIHLLRTVTTLCGGAVVSLCWSSLTAASLNAQQPKDLAVGMAWQVRGLWQAEGNATPIQTGDAIEPGSLLRTSDEATEHSITIFLPDGQRVLYECFTREDCVRGFRVPSLYRTPVPFGGEMLAHIGAALVSERGTSSPVYRSEPASPLPRDEVVAVLSSDNHVHIEGLISRLPMGSYTYDLHSLDGRRPTQFHLSLERTEAPVTLPLPSDGLYRIIVIDELNAQRIDIVVAALTTAQAPVKESFQQAKKLLGEWADFYYGWPVHDFLRAYLESLLLDAKPDQAVARSKSSVSKSSTSSQPANGDAHGIEATSEPKFLPIPGLFKGDIEVTLQSATPGATLHYTVDGSQPMAQSAVYHAPIVVKATELTIKSFASAPGKKDSPVVTGIFRIEH